MHNYKLILTQFDEELREEVQIKLKIDDDCKDFFFEDQDGIFKELMENKVSIKIERI